MTWLIFFREEIMKGKGTFISVLAMIIIQNEVLTLAVLAVLMGRLTVGLFKEMAEYGV